MHVLPWCSWLWLKSSDSGLPTRHRLPWFIIEYFPFLASFTFCAHKSLPTRKLRLFRPLLFSSWTSWHCCLSSFLKDGCLKAWLYLPPFKPSSKSQVDLKSPTTWVPKKDWSVCQIWSSKKDNEDLRMPKSRGSSNPRIPKSSNV